MRGLNRGEELIMEKPLDQRIAYYTRKVAERGRIHPSKKQPRSYTFRSERLMVYKKLMHQQIEERGYRKNNQNISLKLLVNNIQS
jgi:hypothetical protein